MTREEAKRRLEIEKECMNCNRLCYDSYLKPVCENYPFKESHSLKEAIDTAIKTLSAIEDIKAEIEEEWQADMYEDKFGVADCLNIIDKHISGKESE